MTKQTQKFNSLFVEHGSGVDVTIDKVTAPAEDSGNSPASQSHFSDLGIGVLLSWGPDTPLGLTQGHWLCAASKDIVQRFFDQAPGRLLLPDFDPDSLCNLLVTCGIRYLVSTARHMNGFCLFHTETTSFSTQSTPFGRDAHRETLEASRRHGLVTGTYFCPLNLYWAHNAGVKQLHFMHPTVDPRHNPDMHDLNMRQVGELATNYGDSDVWFIDGPPDGLRELIWKNQPNAMVTRGQIPTPEQTLPANSIEPPWETCFTLGTQWTYKPTNEVYKSGREIIEMIIETRAKGGNALLGIGLDHRGRIPFEQERLLQEIGLFLFFSGESIYGTRPWKVPHDGTYFYTYSPKNNAAYAFVPADQVPYATRGKVLLKGVRASDQSAVEIVGQDGHTLQHHPDVDPSATWKNTNDGLLVECTRCYRPYDVQIDMNWPNPFAIRVTHPLQP